jgi:hypothetical protein
MLLPSRSRASCGEYGALASNHPLARHFNVGKKDMYASRLGLQKADVGVSICRFQDLEVRIGHELCRQGPNDLFVLHHQHDDRTLGSVC